jgi:hypothetical protein
MIPSKFQNIQNGSVNSINPGNAPASRGSLNNGGNNLSFKGSSSHNNNHSNNNQLASINNFSHSVKNNHIVTTRNISVPLPLPHQDTESRTQEENTKDKILFLQGEILSVLRVFSNFHDCLHFSQKFIRKGATLPSTMRARKHHTTWTI